jgi:hypothetical protein
MPRPAKGAHLYLRRRSGRPPQWTIRDGGGTGCAQSEHGEAERRLADYLAAEHRPHFGDGDPKANSRRGRPRPLRPGTGPVIGAKRSRARSGRRRRWWKGSMVTSALTGCGMSWRAWRGRERERERDNAASTFRAASLFKETQGPRFGMDDTGGREGASGHCN